MQAAMGLTTSIARRVIERLAASRGYVLQPRPVDAKDAILPKRPLGCEPFQDILRFAQEWQRPVRTFFDIGANVGQTTARALTAFAGAHVHSFEPHPKTFGELQGKFGAD